MKRFADLYALLDETTKTSVKVEALRGYFAEAPPADAAWAVYFLIGRKPRQVVPRAGCGPGRPRRRGSRTGSSRSRTTRSATSPRRSLCCSRRRSARATGRSASGSSSRLLPLRGQGEDDQRAAMLDAWRELDDRQRFVWNKLISGGFRVGVSQQLVTRALAEAGGIDPAVVAHRLMGDWEPSPDVLRPAPGPRPGRRRPQPALSLLPGLCPGAAARGPRRPRGVAGRMEVGRHPLAAHPPRRADLPLVARRGARHRALSRARRRRRRPARRHGHRRRDPPLERGPRPAVRPAPAADRPQGGHQGDPGPGAGRHHGVRPARARRRGLPRLGRWTNAARPWPSESRRWGPSPRRWRTGSGSRRSSRPPSWDELAAPGPAAARCRPRA